MANPYIPFYASDWRSDPKVAMLTLEERGAYIEVLFLMWEMGDDDASLPDDDQMVARQLHLNLPRWKRLKARLATPENGVIQIENGRIFQKRLQECRRKVLGISQKNRENVEKRWAKNEPSERETVYDRITDDLPTKPSQAKPIQEGRGQAPSEPAPPEDDYDFPACRTLTDACNVARSTKFKHWAGEFYSDVPLRQEVDAWKRKWRTDWKQKTCSDYLADLQDWIATKDRFLRQDREKAAATAHEEVRQNKPVTVPEYGVWILPPEVAPPRPEGYPEDAVPVSKEGVLQWFPSTKVPVNARPLVAQ